MWMPEVFDFRFSRKSDRAVVQFCLKCNCQIVLEIKSQIAKNFENMSGCRIPFTYKNVLTSCVQTRELRQKIFYGKLNIPLKTRSSELTTVFLSSCWNGLCQFLVKCFWSCRKIANVDGSGILQCESNHLYRWKVIKRTDVTEIRLQQIMKRRLTL